MNKRNYIFPIIFLLSGMACSAVTNAEIEYESHTLGTISFESPEDYTYREIKDGEDLYFFTEKSNSYFSVIAFDSSWIVEENYNVPDLIQSSITNTYLNEFDNYEIIQDNDLSTSDKIARLQIISGRHLETLSNAVDATYYVFENEQLVSVRMHTASSIESDITQKNLEIMERIYNSISFANAEEPVEILFRGYEWGSSQMSILNSELEKNKYLSYSSSEDHIITGGQRVSDYDCESLYEFNNDSFAAGYYVLETEHTNDNLYYDDYIDLVNLYSEKYGAPYSSKADWKNSLYKDDPEHIGFAISLGHVAFNTTWIDDTSASVCIDLEGDNLNLGIRISYFAPNYEAKRNTDGI